MAAQTEPAAKAPLFERMGGDAAVTAAVDTFYKKILGDPLLSPFFEGVDMKKQMMKQRMFLKYAFGGLPSYSGKSLAKAHEHLIREKGLNLTHFDAVAAHLVATLQELGVPKDLIDEAAAIALSTRSIFDPQNYQ